MTKKTNKTNTTSTKKAAEKTADNVENVKLNDVKIFTEKAAFMDEIVANKMRGDGEILNGMNNVKQMIDKQGKPSPRWYFYLTNDAKAVILELKTNHKKERVAYHYPLAIDEKGGVAFVGGKHDAKEVAHFVQQAAVNYIIEQQKNGAL